MLTLLGKLACKTGLAAKTLALLSLVIVAGFTAHCYAANPFITTIYTADPSARVWGDGRLYVYPSHDIDPPRGCDLMDKYHVFSTDDMVHWRDEGQILQASDVPWGRPEGGFMWAPDCVFRNGTYYFYFPHALDRAFKNWEIGVATSTKPASDFKQVGFIKNASGRGMIDPCVFVDDDGQAYLYDGGGHNCQGGKLKENMVELDGTMQKMEGLDDFHEATWVFKRNSVYYLTYADNHVENKRGANRMQYATSSSPLGPWTSKGIYLEPTGCDTTHGSVVQYKGQWYQFYHNQSISNRGNLRSICVDKLEFNPDGTIQTVVQTKEGPPAVGPAIQPDPSAVEYAVQNAVLCGNATFNDDPATPGGKCLRIIHGPDSGCEFHQVDSGEGGRATLDITFSAIETGKLHLTVNDIDYSYLNTLSTGAWTAYTGHAVFTLRLAPGKANVVQITGATGGVYIGTLTVTPIADH